MEERDLSDKKIALLATDGFEDSELADPKEGITEAGATVHVISNHGGSIKGKNGTEVEVNYTLDEVNAEDYDGLLLPGGVQNPDVMRQDEAAVNFVRAFVDVGKPVAAICHAPWLLIEAGVVEDRDITSWPSLKTDLINAGANWVDEPVVVDNGIVTSRNPDDIPIFTTKAIEEFAEGRHTHSAM